MELFGEEMRLRFSSKVGRQRKAGFGSKLLKDLWRMEGHWRSLWENGLWNFMKGNVHLVGIFFALCVFVIAFSLLCLELHILLP